MQPILGIIRRLKIQKNIKNWIGSRELLQFMETRETSVNLDPTVILPIGFYQLL